MSSRHELLEALRGIDAASVLQEEPYPVIVPRSVEATAEVIRCVRDHQYSVMVLGGGSSFPSDFSVLRSDVAAVMSVGLTGVQTISPFRIRVLSGTPVASVIRGGNVPRKTLGGYLCDLPSRADHAVNRAVWSKIRAVELVNGAGDIRRLAGPSEAAGDDPGMASCLPGSRGRLGMLTAVEFTGPLPILCEGEKDPGMDGGAGEVVLSRTEIQAILDGNSVFQW